jgi:hypothetical protein
MTSKCGAALIAQPDDGRDWRGIERESGNIAAVLPQAVEVTRAALPHACSDDEAVDHAAKAHFADPPALRQMAR